MLELQYIDNNPTNTTGYAGSMCFWSNPIHQNGEAMSSVNFKLYKRNLGFGLVIITIVALLTAILCWQSDSTDTNTTQESPEVSEKTEFPDFVEGGCSYSETEQVQVRTCTTITTNTIQIQITLERLDGMNDHMVEFWLEGYSSFPRECLFSAKDKEYVCDYEFIGISEGDYRVVIQIDDKEKENASPTFTLG